MGRLPIILLLALTGCQDPQPTRQELESKMAGEAYGAAFMLADAWRQCRIVGVDDVDKCRSVAGSLADEAIAKALADAAVDARASYHGKCIPVFGREYCESLLRRAIAIELKKQPVEG